MLAKDKLPRAFKSNHNSQRRIIVGKPVALCIAEGPFQSDALLVPENCLFDHIHNQTRCWEFDRWNQTAAQSCQDRDLSLRSFAMLLPCGISLFSGVEFVCCPTKGKIELSLKKGECCFQVRRT